MPIYEYYTINRRSDMIIISLLDVKDERSKFLIPNTITMISTLVTSDNISGILTVWKSFISFQKDGTKKPF